MPSVLYQFLIFPSVDCPLLELLGPISEGFFIHQLYPVNFGLTRNLPLTSDLSPVKSVTSVFIAFRPSVAAGGSPVEMKSCVRQV